MSSPNEPKSTWKTVATTLPRLPLPLNADRPAIETERLIIRSLCQEDLGKLHELRTQPEVMKNHPQGRADRSLEETQSKLSPFLPPNDASTYNFAICLKETGEMIGIGGCHSLDSPFGWPAIGYMLRQECWGRGLTTEFLRAWLAAWCKLARETTEVKADPRSLLEGNGSVREQVTAITVRDNVGSQRVLEKAGFERFLIWREPDLRNKDVEVELLGYRYFPFELEEEFRSDGSV